MSADHEGKAQPEASEQSAPPSPVNERSGPYLTAKLRAIDGKLGKVVPRVTAAQQDSEAVHDLRVALRRARTILEVGRAVFGPYCADQTRRALRDLQQVTGVLRDEEVLLELLVSLRVEAADVAAWIESHRRRERRLRSGLRRMVQAGEIDRGRRLIDALLIFPIKPSRERRLAKFARQCIRRAKREIDHHKIAPIDDIEALHRLRIAYKRLRYTVEAFTDVLPPELAALAKAAARFQGLLGDLHDIDVALACVRRARTLSPEGRSTLLDALARKRADRAAAYESEQSAAAIAPAAGRQDAGTDSLRKISTR